MGPANPSPTSSIECQPCDLLQSSVSIKIINLLFYCRPHHHTNERPTNTSYFANTKITGFSKVHFYLIFTFLFVLLRQLYIYCLLNELKLEIKNEKKKKKKKKKKKS